MKKFNYNSKKAQESMAWLRDLYPEGFTISEPIESKTVGRKNSDFIFIPSQSVHLPFADFDEHLKAELEGSKTSGRIIYKELYSSGK